jgi:hypothetical protein
MAAGGGKGFGGSDDSEAVTSTPAPANTQVSLWGRASRGYLPSLIWRKTSTVWASCCVPDALKAALGAVPHPTPSCYPQQVLYLLRLMKCCRGPPSGPSTQALWGWGWHGHCRACRRKSRESPSSREIGARYYPYTVWVLDAHSTSVDSHKGNHLAAEITVSGHQRRRE